MRLIVDSGSTKTDWIAIDEYGSIIFETFTLGLNPQVLTEYIIEERIINNYDLYQNRKKVNKIFFYGAGCGTQPPKDLLSKVLRSIFINSEFDIKEDTYAAVYSCCKPNENAIVSILGTGSNCSYFDGNKLNQKVTSLGYVLMDDASGNYFGRQLLRDYYFNRFPPDLEKKFKSEFDLQAEVIKDSLYKKPNPNTYLAKFAKFLVENKNLEYSKQLNQIEQFENHKNVNLHFVGSIGYYLKEELREALYQKQLKIGKVLRRPIEGLVAFHQSN
jgi:N-acetylglucosamine kinase-like BadF-type ATPase